MEYRVLLGTCGTPHREFLASVVGLVIDFAEKGEPGNSHYLGIAIQKGSILPQLRHRLVRRAQELGATHILFADSDQDFPPYALRQLLSHRLPVVGANIATKMIPSSPTARHRHEVVSTGTPVEPKETGVEKVWRLGLGFTLIEMGVFDTVPPPWFEVRYKPEVDDYEGEDWYFMAKLEAAGIGVYVDHGLSLGVGHWGDIRFDLGMVERKHGDILLPFENRRIIMPWEIGG
jgi:hypothetical protein